MSSHVCPKCGLYWREARRLLAQAERDLKVGRMPDRDKLTAALTLAKSCPDAPLK